MCGHAIWAADPTAPLNIGPVILELDPQYRPREGGSMMPRVEALQKFVGIDDRRAGQDIGVVGSASSGAAKVSKIGAGVRHERIAWSPNRTAPETRQGVGVGYAQ